MSLALSRTAQSLTSPGLSSGSGTTTPFEQACTSDRPRPRPSLPQPRPSFPVLRSAWDPMWPPPMVLWPASPSSYCGHWCRRRLRVVVATVVAEGSGVAVAPVVVVGLGGSRGRGGRRRLWGRRGCKRWRTLAATGAQQERGQGAHHRDEQNRVSQMRQHHPLRDTRQPPGSFLPHVATLTGRVGDGAAGTRRLESRDGRSRIRAQVDRLEGHRARRLAGTLPSTSAASSTSRLPTRPDPTGDFYAFEKGAERTSAGDGFADVWLKDHFGWSTRASARTCGRPTSSYSTTTRRWASRPCSSCATSNASRCTRSGPASSRGPTTSTSRT